MTELFRKEVIREKSYDNIGRVSLHNPTSHNLVTLALASFVILIISFVFFFQMPKVVAATGFLVPEKGIVKVFSPINGNIKEAHIEEGDEINENEVLFSIVNDEQQANSHSRSFIENTVNISRAITETFESDYELLEIEKNKLLLSKASLHQQIKFKRETKKKYEELYEKKKYRYEIIINSDENQYLSAQNILALNEEITADAINITSIADEVMTMSSEVGLIELQIDEINKKKGKLKADRELRLKQLAKENVSYEKKLTQNVSAPVGGVISNLVKQTGQSVEAGEQILDILPKNSILEAELYVPSFSIASLDINQNVILKYEAFPYQKFGTFKGEIKSISQTLVSPKSLNEYQKSEQPVYRVVVMLEKQQIGIGDKVIKLQSGIKVQADIVTGYRSFFDTLVDI